MKQFPDHGETICMKGLLLNSLDQKEEAYKLAKDGLKKDLKSHVCWHVLGLLHRSDRNYPEATKCYKSALRMDPGNAQIMRDLSLLQLRERDLVGFTDTRRQLLAAKPGVKQNWLSFVISEHLRGAPESALEVMQKMDEAFAGQDEPMGRVERSELILYKATICVEVGKLEEAIDVLSSHEIVDSVGKNELVAYILYRQGNFERCKQVLNALLAVNSSHEGYLLTVMAVSGVFNPAPSHESVRHYLRLGETGFALSAAWSGYDAARISELHNLASNLSAGELEARLAEIKDEFIGHQVKSEQFDLIALMLLPVDSEEFKNRLAAFVQTKLDKGVPSTFKMLRRVCKNPKKQDVVREVFERMVDDSSSGSPVRKTFALMGLASLFDFAGNHLKAIELIDEALKLTPTLIDLYVSKAKILKHLGDLETAAYTWEFARKLDLADRYLNSKSVKAMLRIGEIEKAKETIMLFAKDSSDSTQSNLSEMQCMWWEFELGKALVAKADTDKAREVWKGTLKHFEDMAEDEFDFALYCLRKMTLRAYIDFLRFGSRTRTHKYYRRTVEQLEKLDTPSQ